MSEKTFSDAKQIIVIRPKSVVENVAFHYADFSDVKKLIQFVGSKPTIDENAAIWFGKFLIPDDSLVVRDSFGRVSTVLTMEQAETKYNVVASHDFKTEDIAEVRVKVVKEGSKRGGITRAEIVAELKSLEIEYDVRGSKAELEATLEAAKK
jgi:hypothetical protein